MLLSIKQIFRNWGALFLPPFDAALIPRLILPAVLLLALLLRILAFLDLKTSIYFDFLLWDERVYHTWAVQIAAGTYAPSTVYAFSPVPAYVLAALYTLFSPDVLYFRLFNIGIGVIVCLLSYLVGKELGDRSTGIIAALLAAVYEPFIFYSIVPLPAALSVLVFGLVVYLFLVAVRHMAPWKIFLLGLAAGLAPNVRGNFVVLVPLIGVLVWLRQSPQKASLTQRGIKLGVYLLGVTVSAAPFMVRNYRVGGDPVWLPYQTGFNLYLGNHLGNPGPYYFPVPFASPAPIEQSIQFTIEASRRYGKQLSPQEASAYWTQETVNIALQHPRLFVWKLVQKTLAVCHQFEPDDHYQIRFLSQFVLFGVESTWNRKPG